MQEVGQQNIVAKALNSRQSTLNNYLPCTRSGGMFQLEKRQNMNCISMKNGFVDTQVVWNFFPNTMVSLSLQILIIKPNLHFVRVRENVKVFFKKNT